MRDQPKERRKRGDRTEGAHQRDGDSSAEVWPGGGGDSTVVGGGRRSRGGGEEMREFSGEGERREERRGKK